MTTLDLRPAPQAAPAAARVRNHALTEVRLVMRNGEQLLLALVIPIGIYVVVAVVSGAVFIVEAAQLLRRANAGLRDALLKPMGLFHWSNTYLSLLFLAIAVDPLIHL